MSNFDEYIQKINEDIALLVENDGMAGDGTGVMTGEAPTEAPPTVATDTSPNPAQGAETTQATFDKPYKELGEILYRAYLFDPSKVEANSVYERKLNELNPNEVESDEQGNGIFKTINMIMDHYSGSKMTSNEPVDGSGI